MATIIAIMAPINTVPQNSGMAPKPVSPRGPATALGFHSVPKRKSIGETMEKKRAVSKTSERKIPTVVMIAISDASSRTIIVTRSIFVRALRSGLIFSQA